MREKKKGKEKDKAAKTELPARTIAVRASENRPSVYPIFHESCDSALGADSVRESISLFVPPLRGKHEVLSFTTQMSSPNMIYMPSGGVLYVQDMERGEF